MTSETAPSDPTAEPAAPAKPTKPAAGATPSRLERARGDASAAIWTLCAGYLAIELAYILHGPLVMDEFQGAFAVERLAHEVPYRDYQPYKTVLGYYLQWPALALASALGLDLWGRMLAVKLAMASATAGVLLVAALRLRRFVDPLAVALGLALLVCMSTFLERSAALRVDMLTALFGLASLMALLDQRTRRAGLLAGLSFLVSQKGIYYALAGGVGLGFDWLWALRAGSDDRGARLRRGVEFTLFAGLPVALYFGGFASLTSGSTLSDGVVASAGRIALDGFADMSHFWLQTIARNPAFYAALVAGLGVLSAARRGAGGAGTRDRVLLGYGAVLLGLCLWHRQPWPYFFVLLLPTGFVLASRALETALEQLSHRPLRALQLATAAFVVVGILLPLSRVPRVLTRDNQAQRTTVELASRTLEPGDAYLGGLEFVFTHRQVPGLSWLDAQRLAALAAQPPSDLARLEERIEQARPRLVIWNYRIARLPEALLSGIKQSHAPLFGNLLIYSPTLATGEQEVDVWFSGRYALSGPGGGAVEIDGAQVRVGDEVRLAPGMHRAVAGAGYRLHLVPDEIEQHLAGVDPALARPRPLFEAPYRY